MTSSDTTTESCDICEEIQQQGLKSQPPKLTSAGKTVLAIGAGVAAVIYGVALPFVTPGFRKICLPYVPATEHQISNILTCLRGRTGSMIDLGSGDGRVVFSVAKAIASKNEDISISKADGVELNRWLVWYSKIQSWRKRQLTDEAKISFYRKDIFKTDLGIYDNITVFGVESLMEALEYKLKDELKDGAIIVACRFPMPNWEPISTIGEGIDRVWVYDTRSINEGTAV